MCYTVNIMNLMNVKNNKHQNMQPGHTQRRILSGLTAFLVIAAMTGGMVPSYASQNIDQGSIRQIVFGEELTGFAKDEVFYDGDDLIIAAAGTYQLSGELDGKLKVSASKEDDVTLILNGVTIRNDVDEALEVRKTASITIVLAEDSENVIISGTSEDSVQEDGTDASQEDAEDSEEEDASGGAVHTHVETIITGEGSLKVEGYINNGLQCSKDLTIEDGRITGDDRIRGKNA